MGASVSGTPTAGNSIPSLSPILSFVSDRIDFNGLAQTLVALWRVTRAMVVAPLLRIAILLCLVMTLMILLEKICFGMVSLIVKTFRLKPEKRYRWEPIRPDVELGTLAYPKVLIQIPMFNEKEVYKLSIGAACMMDWPTDRLIIQVLDDSTDAALRESVSMECHKWRSQGMNIYYVVRDNRRGYKAGALHDGMKKDYVDECDYVAMFDADFQPDSDFLLRTVPFLVYNPNIALVQARWKFVNANECLITRIQEMSLDYHFKVEQEAGSSTFAFFGFNGTAGVWRISAIHDAGGWNDRTTVEDMDLSVRAGLAGWKFVYVGNIKVRNELPSTFKAYRFQQHRWSCGPANLFKKMAIEIIMNKKVSFWKKLYVLYSFFFVSKIVAHTVTFIFYCIVIPLTVLVPEIEVPHWGVVYVPTMITFCKAIATPSSFHLVIIWVLFENVMSFHRLKAAVTGLLEARRVNEWIVTEKLGDAHRTKPAAEHVADIEKLEDDARVTKPLLEHQNKEEVKTRFWHRFYASEIVLGLLLLLCGGYDFAFAKSGYFIYLFLQGIAFLVMGFGYVGTHVPAGS
ncbi:LOW QUALITY PROTEIN: probable mannan synthase 11 [Asparagus officinalis]|uniref:LOW QUALITY PROTEIN: probable mannan synthase 11 n=1 Tax=Asparagus officinalis TaxID=4686 RepID=UPI00098E7EE6|nr:LOW QUALITY PROTEIN: probable mannan synthase 11 [Asparagus officinalis]